MLTLTQAQLDALYRLYQTWQTDTEGSIMPKEFKVDENHDYSIGVYVGTPRLDSDVPGRMYICILTDGSTHS